MLDNSKNPINNSDINKVGDKVTWTQKMLSINSDCIKSKSHNDNCNKNNHNIDNRVGGEEQGSDDLKSPE